MHITVTSTVSENSSHFSLLHIFSVLQATGQYKYQGKNVIPVILLACVAADSFPFPVGAEIEQESEKRASEGARLG